MWNPFQKETFWESLEHKLHRDAEQKRKKKILLASGWGLVILAGIIMLMNPKSPPPPEVDEVVIHVSGEAQTGVTQDDPKVPKAGEICMRHPDIFLFHYSGNRETIDLKSIDLQFKTIHDLASKWAIMILDQKKLKSNLERECFGGNPIWTFSIEENLLTEPLMKLSEKYGIPLWSWTGEVVSGETFVGFNIQRHELDEFSTPEFIRELLRKYLELESGGLFKNLP